MKALSVLLTIFATAFLLSCGAKPELQGDYSEQPSVAIPIDSSGGLAMLYGTWNAVCNSGISKQAVFSGDNFTLSLKIYGESSCTNLTYTLEYKGTYSALVDYQPVSGDEGPLDWTYYSATITPASISVANTMNGTTLCGLSGWASGVSKNVSGRTCNGEPMITQGQILYDTFHYATVNGASQTAGDLWFGIAQDGSPVDGSTSAKRLIVYNAMFPFRK